MKKTRVRRYKKRNTRKCKTRFRKGGTNGLVIDPRLGLPLPLSDMMDSIYSSATSLNNTILGKY